MNSNFRKVLTSRYLLIPVIALLLYAIMGFLLFPLAIRWYVPKYVREHLRCQVSLNDVRINPFFLTLEARGFSLAQPDGSPLASFDRFFVDYKMTGLFRRAVIFREISLDRPVLNVVFEPDGTLNLQKLFPKPSQPLKNKDTKTDPEPLRMLMENAAIHGGKLTIADRRKSEPTDLTFEKFSFDLKNLSTMKEQNGQFFFKATTPEGERIEWEGHLSILPLRSKGKLSLSGVKATTLWGFVRDSLNLDPPRGDLNVAATYQLDAGATPIQMVLEGLKIDLSDFSFKLHDSEKSFLNLTRAELVAPSLDLAARTLQVEKILLEGGAVDIRIDNSGHANIQRIIRESRPIRNEEQKTPLTEPVLPPTSENSSPVTPDSPFKVLVDAVDIKGVAVDWSDLSRKNPLKGAVSSVDLHFKANIEAGSENAKVLLNDFASELKAVRFGIGQSAETQFHTEGLKIEGGECDLSARSLTVSRIALSNGNIDVSRDADGQLNWLKLFSSRGGTAVGEAESRSTPASGPVWKYLVKSFEIDGFQSKFSDHQMSPQQPLFNIQGCNVKLTGIDGKSPMGFSVGFQVQEKGSVSISGQIAPAVPSVEADVKVANLGLTPLQPYLEPFITLVLRSGTVSTEGKFRYGLPGKGPNLAYEGSFSVARLSLTEPNSEKTYIGFNAVQIPKLSLTLGPNKLEAAEVVVLKPEGELKIAEDRTVNLAKILKEKGSKGKAGPPPKTSEKGGYDSFHFNIGRIRLQEGNILFADFSLMPRFQARIHDLKGMVSGLTSGKESVARMQFDGKVDQYGMAKIEGATSPYDFKRSTDIDIIFRNIEMTSLSPYSGKFAGWKIQSGKLSMDLKYKIQENKLVGDNKIVVDNLVLGEKVESPDAVNLPLKLAVALMKDSNGRIDIGLPVTGDLDNPQFSIGALVWKALINVLSKAVTAPFNTLGALFGGRETAKFDSIDFDPGSDELMPPEKEKLKKLADALQKRPELKLEVQGRYSPEADGMQLKDLAVRRAVFKLLGTKLEGNGDPGPLDLADSKTRNMLENLFKERFGKTALIELEQGIKEGKIKQRIPTGQQEQKESKKAGRLSRLIEGVKLYRLIPGGKSPEQAALWAGEIYVRLVESEPVADESLLELGRARSRAIVRELQTRGEIPEDRVDTKDPEGTPEDAEPKAKLSLGAT